MSSNALYTNLSAYYDLMCADINYAEQSHAAMRLFQLFGNGGTQCVDLGCGTGPHVRHFLDNGFSVLGLDLNQPMLDLAKQRCPEAHFIQGDMATFALDKPVDLMTCFLYSIHYNATLTLLSQCITHVYHALNVGGIFCFNAVNKLTINNNDCAYHQITKDNADFIFQSGWRYNGSGEQQSLWLSIEKNTADKSEIWHDEHTMVAVSFVELQQLLMPYFDVQIFEHSYDSLQLWQGVSGNAIFVCSKRENKQR